jgi:repressor LexA
LQSLTPIERRVYHYLLDFLTENTYQPSVREIGRRFHLRSTKSVVDILQSLATKGYIQREAGRSRGVRLVGFSSIGQAQPVPLYSTVNAVEPCLTEENRERFIAMDRSFVPADDAFFIRSPDDGLTDRGIQCGDLVLVNPSARAREGDAVAARLGEDLVVRMLSHRGPHLVLTPSASGSMHAEIVVGPGDDFAILGTVATVIRPVHAPATDTLVADVVLPEVAVAEHGNGPAWVSAPADAPQVT